MQPIFSDKERSFDIKIEDVEKVLDKNYKEEGSTLKAVQKLRKILENYESD